MSAARHLQDAGYRTGFVGKYLNLYTEVAPYIPPGWDRFVGTLPHDDWTDYDVAFGSSGSEATMGELVHSTVYNTTYVHQAALDFLDEVGDEPFALFIFQLAPHAGSQPLDSDRGSYEGTTWRGGAYDEPDVSDKPSHIRELPRLDEPEAVFGANTIDREYQKALESLVELDRTVGELVDRLESSGRIDDTVLVYASDNGHLFGEHRLWSKGLPYEESLRVPLAVRMPGGVSGVEQPQRVSVTTDVMATLYELAGVDAPTGGTSLAPVLRGEEPAPAQALLLEGYSTAWSPDYNGLLTEQHKYVEYVNGEVELYDLVADPFEEENRAGEEELASVQAELASELEARKSLVVLPQTIRAPTGSALSVSLEHWGGQGEVRFSTEDPLPDGLSLSPEGVISGVPTTPGSTSITVLATDSVPSAYDGHLPGHQRIVWLEIVAALGEGGQLRSKKGT